MTATAIGRKTGWTADDSTFGARLALIRQRMGWGNVEKAAKACGISTETWRSWERDNREPHRPATVAKQISGATGCDYYWLLVGPEGGDGGTTRQYFDDTRLVATVGEPHGRPSIRRPVKRTRPTARRPLTPTAA